MAETGVAVFGVTPSSVVLRTPNALSVMFDRVTVDAAAPTSRTAAPRRRFWLFSVWFARGYGTLLGVGANTLPIGLCSP
jgi:hypothetical protein